jgi:hypothetical protein
MLTNGAPPPDAAALVLPEEPLPLDVDLLLEQPEMPAATMAAAAATIVSSRFTCAPLPM